MESDGALAIWDALEPNRRAPLGQIRALGTSNTKLTETRTFRFDRPLRAFGLTRIGVAKGASLPMWRLEALDEGGNILATTGQLEYCKDPLPRTYEVRAEGIRAARLFCDNNSANKRPWASYTSPPIVEITLEYE
jgi:hypothetical protein